MVRQYVQRGDKEETGYDIRIIEQLECMNDKYTFRTEIIGGNQELDKSNKANEDIIEIAWISLQDQMKFDAYTRPIIDRFCVGGIS